MIDNKIRNVNGTEHVIVRCKERGCLDIYNFISVKCTIEQDIHAIERDNYKILLMISLLVDTIGKEGMHVSAMVLLKLVRHMTYRNFQIGEQIMSKHNYYKLEHHTNEHHKLLGYIDGLIVLLDTTNNENEIDAGTVSQFITKWHSKHALISDGALIDYLAGIIRQPGLASQECSHG